jgi:tetratricopeptide (TPR) repeat protein
MNKICLVFICLLYAGQGIAQTSDAILPQTPQLSGAINIAVSNLDESDGDDYFAEAEKNEKKGDLNDAVTLFGKAAFEYNNARKFSQYGAALLRLSNVHFLMAHYTEAEQVTLNVALKNYSRIGSKVGQMDSYGQLGKIYLAANKPTQALWFYTQQGIVAKQIGNNSAYIESVLGLAQVKTKKKEYTLASRDLNRAELLAKSANITKFKNQIRDARALLPVKTSVKKQI